MTNKKFILNTEDFILYILNKLEPERSDKIRLNKLAFFVEFAYFLKFNTSLSDAEYAAINMGPVIDGYELILKDMSRKKLVKIDDYLVRPLGSPKTEIPEEVGVFIDGIMEKYSRLNKSELIALSHATDAYKITTHNECIMGSIIDKKLSLLETFLDDDNEQVEKFLEDELPKIDRSQLVQYVIG